MTTSTTSRYKALGSLPEPCQYGGVPQASPGLLWTCPFAPTADASSVTAAREPAPFPPAWRHCASPADRPRTPPPVAPCELARFGQLEHRKGSESDASTASMMLGCRSCAKATEIDPPPGAWPRAVLGWGGSQFSTRRSVVDCDLVSRAERRSRNRPRVEARKRGTWSDLPIPGPSAAQPTPSPTRAPAVCPERAAIDH